MKELGVYEQLTQLAYLPSYFKLLQGAIELNVFSHLTVPVTAEHLAYVFTVRFHKFSDS